MGCIRDDWGDVRRKALREPGAISSSTAVRMKICKYCSKTATANVNGIDHCDSREHTDWAMFGKPREEIAA